MGSQQDWSPSGGATCNYSEKWHKSKLLKHVFVCLSDKNSHLCLPVSSFYSTVTSSFLQKQMSALSAGVTDYKLKPWSLFQTVFASTWFYNWQNLILWFVLQQNYPNRRKIFLKTFLNEVLISTVSGGSEKMVEKKLLESWLLGHCNLSLRYWLFRNWINQLSLNDVISQLSHAFNSSGRSNL